MDDHIQKELNTKTDKWIPSDSNLDVFLQKMPLVIFDANQIFTVDWSTADGIYFLTYFSQIYIWIKIPS